MNAEEAAAAIASNTEGVYDEVEIEDMEFDEEKKIYTYPCPCGDKFVISEEELMNGEEIARCPSCSLYIRVIYEVEEEEEEDKDSSLGSATTIAVN
ncbi:CSL zinc finger domain containing protein [Acanthamoeba castellanii str. Neff]|uniref:Diphthamide biosynthesis protein 3 n=1 Tax=Acanthamoeba castellanii (strain ATCC 30010 / Neff) TaxID=1257118 RepID=L8GR42_ACACF|nr:CSL zinc finger domain containing protein [Acanthamoeba castellanii str. Neff]ELR15475.1 CSL zinc finger domain containing protein [Acanthamoeba castellanii str. Neff]